MTDFCQAAATIVRSDVPDLSLRQLAILGMVCDDPGLSVKPIADGLGLHKPVVSRAVRSLWSLGLVQQGESAGDRRMVEIVATVEGARLRKALGGAA